RRAHPARRPRPARRLRRGSCPGVSLSLHQVPQALESQPGPRLHCPQGLAETDGDLRLRQTLEEGELDYPPLWLGQVVERRSHEASPLRGYSRVFRGRAGSTRGYRIVHGRHEGLLSSTYGTEPVDCSRLRAHDQPRLGAASVRIVAGGLLPDLPEDLLQHLFRRRRIAENTANEPQGQARESVVEAPEGVPIALGNSREEPGGIRGRRARALHTVVITTSLPSPGQYIQGALLSRRNFWQVMSARRFHPTIPERAEAAVVERRERRRACPLSKLE